MIEKCVKYGLSLDELFILDSILMQSELFTQYYCTIGIADEMFFKLRRYDLIQKVDKEKPYVVDGNLSNLEITDKGKGILLDKVTSISSKKLDWIQEYRLLFKGIKPQSMGDRNACESNMQWFLKRYPEFSKEQILAAAKKHIHDNSNKPQYTRRADYFIKKQDANRGVTSDLLMYLENDSNEVPADIVDQV